MRMPKNISSSSSECIHGYVLEGKECGAKPDFHGTSTVSGASCRKFKYEFLYGRTKERYFSCPAIKLLETLEREKRDLKDENFA